MRKNHEIKTLTPLLNKDGNVKEPGFCKKMLYDYKRSEITANPLRIKEWDFYQILNNNYMVQVVVFDISFGGAANVAIVDLNTGKRGEFLSVKPLTLGKMNMPENTELDHEINYSQGKMTLNIKKLGSKRYLKVIVSQKVDINIELTEFPNQESLVMAVPFHKQGYFYLNEKMNCMSAQGYCKIDDVATVFNPEMDFAVLDWGRGVWPYKCSWYWGNGSTRLPDGRVFGFEIGWGFGDMSAACENTLFIDAKAHKIGDIKLRRDKSNWLSPWCFTSDDQRFEMTMTPVFDNHTSSRIGVVGNICHQVFGKFNGTVTLDDGEILQIENMLAFCEFSDNRW